MDWQRTAIEAAASYLRELIDAGRGDARTRSIYDGLVDVLDPVRRASRIEQALATDATAAVTQAVRDRRSNFDRRGHSDRRLVNLGPPASGERRRGQERRGGLERRSQWAKIEGWRTPTPPTPS